MPVITKPVPWSTLIVNMQVDQVLSFPADDERSVRSMISGRIKRNYPLRVYKTTVIDTYTLTVTRKADKKPKA